MPLGRASVDATKATKATVAMAKNFMLGMNVVGGVVKWVMNDETEGIIFYKEDRKSKISVKHMEITTRPEKEAINQKARPKLALSNRALTNRTIDTVIFLRFAPLSSPKPNK